LTPLVENAAMDGLAAVAAVDSHSDSSYTPLIRVEGFLRCPDIIPRSGQEPSTYRFVPLELTAPNLR
jgi:hypothetical protein